MNSFLDLSIDVGNAATAILAIGLTARDGFAILAMGRDKRMPIMPTVALFFGAMIWRAIFMLAIFGIIAWITGFPLWPKAIFAALRG